MLQRHQALETLSLSQWCWQVCDRESLAVAMAATNYAIEGATGEWSARVCSETAMPSCLMNRCVPRP
jgi:pyrroloquinoline quinone (PQQ) biosynthesis protein C